MTTVANSIRCLLVMALSAALAGCGGASGNFSGTAPGTSFTLSGTVSHLDTGSVSISDGSETVTIAQGATSFSFGTPLADGSSYAVTVTSQPAGASCVVNNGAGTVMGAAVTNIAIVCNTLVSQPLSIGVSASGSVVANGSRIFLPVSQVGGVATTINAVLDTGSAGTALRASDVFPASVVTSNGFVFPSGQTSLTYNGITVTNVVATRVYGTQGNVTTQQTGNLGFAQVTFGTGTGVTTAMMPVLLVYQTQANGQVVTTTNFANLIGVAPGLAGITVGGVAATSPPPCTAQSTASCGLASPFRFFSYAAGVDKGYVLNKVAFAACDITVAGACPVTPSLAVGVTASTIAGFTTTNLSSCGSVTLIGSASEPYCSQVIPGVTIASGNASFTGPAIFDSGYPSIRLSVPAGMSFPTDLPQGSTVSIAAGQGFAYRYMTGTGYLATSVITGAAPNDYSNLGIAFFAQNALLVDYTKAVEGWRNG